MATKRTPEEILEIVGHCVRLEEEGGDILGYLWSQNYISPRATWMNFQREHLGRKPYQYTDGKPTTKGRKKEMFRVTDEIRGEAIRIALEGGDPKKYLKEQGCKEPICMWSKIKMALKEASPEIFEQLPARIGAKPQPMKVKTEPEKLGPEPPKPGTVPLQYNGYDVCCIRGKYGEFYWDKTHGYMDWRTNDGDEVSMKPEAWMEFATEEVQKVMAILGAMPEEKE